MSASSTTRRVDLETLVIWAVKTQRADCDDVSLFDIEREVDPHLSRRPLVSTDGVATMLRRGNLGCQVDGGGLLRTLSSRTHPDAETVMAAVNRVRDLRRRGLVLHYARAGYRPDFESGKQRLVAMPAKSGAGRGNKCRIEGEWEPTPERSVIARRMMATGRPIVDRYGRSVIDAAERGFRFDHGTDGQRRVFVRWCPLVEEPSLTEIRAVNETYAEWHAGMMTLLGQLVGVPLREFRLTGFKAPTCPWGEGA